MEKPIKVLIIESSIELINNLKEPYEKIFMLSGYEPDYFEATSLGEAKKIVKSDWPHVILCDMSLGQTNDGLLVIKSLREDFPDIFRILASGNDYSSRDVYAKKAFFDMYFDKSEIIGSKQGYLEERAQRFKELFKLNTCLKIDDTDANYKEDFKGNELREFNSLLAQATFTGHDADAHITPNTIKISKISGGFSGSKVYKLHAYNSDSGLESVTSVIKVSKTEYARLELNNYNKFVKWGLPYSWRVDVLGYAFTKSFGAIVYSFIPGEPGTDFNSLTHYLEIGDYQIATNVISRIFSTDTKRWYGDELVDENDINIVEHYNNRYFRGEEAKNISEKIFTTACADIFGKIPSGKTLEINNNITVTTPIIKLFSEPRGNYFSCICHGDLNSNNVIVSKDEKVIFIDFQETGRGHVFEDFVTIESSIRLLGQADIPTNWLSYLDDEIEFSRTGNTKQSKPLELIAKIRSLAFNNFPKASKSNYFYAVAIFHFRLLRANLTLTQKNKCVVAIIAALTRI